MSLGVEAPADIDLEVIAFTLQAEVRYRQLDSCEARIIGYKGRAIITIDPSRGAPRARSSIGQELGHWHYHRGRSSICRSSEIGNHDQQSKLGPERVADSYAADLLLPPYLFAPASRKFKRVTFAGIEELATVFRSSRTATALRVLDYGPEPAVLVCHGIGGRRWFRRGKGIPDRWFPRDELDAESNAFEALHCGLERPLPFVIGADAWFERREAERYEVFEQTVSAGGGDILTLLTFKDAEMLD
jgi:hypothetical protein